VTISDNGSVLAGMGFSAFFSQQLALEERAFCDAGRVLRVQRSGVAVACAVGEAVVPLDGHWWALPAAERPTVGDWVLLDAAHERVQRVLERKSVLQRAAAGTRVDVQLIAANVDTALIVTSCNADFNPSRLERYLAWTLEAGIEAVLVLTKADLASDADAYREAAMRVRRGLCIEVVNALDPATLGGVLAWCGAGQTLVLIGSSGVGKSTLLNSLAGESQQATAAIREQDARGRHTTTDRSLHALPGGAWLLDSPGIRALSLVDSAEGLAELFDDVAALATECRFHDCGHASEPGCAIQAAIASGRLEPRRLANWRKLLREEIHAQETYAEQRRRHRAFSRRVRQVMKEKNRGHP
jgi:ribosome biogenesis GTPase